MFFHKYLEINESSIAEILFGGLKMSYGLDFSLGPKKRDCVWIRPFCMVKIYIYIYILSTVSHKYIEIHADIGIEIWPRDHS